MKVIKYKCLKRTGNVKFYVYLVCIMTRTNIQPTLMLLVMSLSNYYVIQFGYEDLRLNCSSNLCDRQTKLAYKD